MVSTNVDDEFPSLSFEISQQWSELGDLPDFTYTHRPVTRSDATSSELDGTPPTPSSDSERSYSRARRLPHVYSYRLLAGQQLSFDLLCHTVWYKGNSMFSLKKIWYICIIKNQAGIFYMFRGKALIIIGETIICRCLQKMVCLYLQEITTQEWVM